MPVDQETPRRDAALSRRRNSAPGAGDHQAIIDGEIGAQHEMGVAKLENLHRAIEASAYERLIYVAFDLLFLDGVDLRSWPLLSRKEALRDLLKPLEVSRIQYSDHLEGDPMPLYERLCELGAEGIVSKAAHAPYRGGRDPCWLKVKCRGWAAEHAKVVEKWNIKKQSLLSGDFRTGAYLGCRALDRLPGSIL